jgi:hypothetical protein
MEVMDIFHARFGLLRGSNVDIVCTCTTPYVDARFGGVAFGEFAMLFGFVWPVS